jgi:O-antigen/teichoic acid export membrane protein
VPYLDLTALTRRVLHAGGWNVAGYGLAQAIRLGGNLVMTRLLVPEMFGVMAIATMVSVILSLLSDIGLRTHIVQSQRGDDPIFLDTAWVVQIVRGFFLWFAALGISMALHLANREGMLPDHSVYASPILPLVIAVTSFSAVISGFQSTKWATALRHFDQKRIMQIELISQLVALVIMIVIGVASHSIWALIAGGLIGWLTTTVLSHTWMQGERNRLRWEKSAFNELIHFGKWIFLSSILSVLAGNGDLLLLGALVDTDVMGLYAIAILLVGAIGGGLTRLFSSVLLPALSEIVRNDPSRLREVYYRLRVPCDVLLLFLAGLLFAASQLIIDLLYDPRYGGAGDMLQVLALSFIAIRYHLAKQVYLAAGMPQYLVAIHLVVFVSLYTLVPLLYHFAGIQAAIWGIALHELVSLPLVFIFNARFGLNDFRRERLMLLALPAGWLCGSGLHLLPW